jgi:hypothetical protein
MADNISKAQECLKKVKYFYEYAEPAARYNQALFHYSELGELYKKAKSGEQPIIREIYNEAGKLMVEMKA